MRKLEWPILILLIGGLVGIGFFVNQNLGQNPKTEVAGEIDIDNGDLDIDWAKLDQFNFKLNDTINIYKSGT